MIMSENIHQPWKKKKIYTAIFMDIAGAFNNVHHDRLIHNLRKRPHKYKPLKSARARYIKAAAKEQWHTIWSKNTKTAASLKRITRATYTKAGPALYNEIADRNWAAKIVQLRTGHCRLNRYLHRFGLKNSPYCQCGYGKETVEHYLLECRNYTNKERSSEGKLERGGCAWQDY